MSVSINQLSISSGNKSIIEDLSLWVHAGNRCLVHGPSGCGKTTLLKAIPGFVAVDSGIIEVNGVRLSPESVFNIRCSIAYVPQFPFVGKGSVRAHIQRPFGYKANRHLKDKLARLPELLEALKLHAQILDEAIETLSGGEHQRISLIVALLLDRSVLLLDEPTSALDPNNRKAVFKLLESMTDKTMLVAGHSLDAFPAADQRLELSTHA